MKNLDLNNAGVEVLNFDEMYEHNGGSGAAAPSASPTPAPSPSPGPNQPCHRHHHHGRRDVLIFLGVVLVTHGIWG